MMTHGRMLIASCACAVVPLVAQAVHIESVLVGNSGNPPDTEIMTDGTTGYGAVPYEYRIGKYEVTNVQYAEFLNAVDPIGTNTLRLYFSGMSTSQHGGINFNAAASNGLKYAAQPGRENFPVIYVTWYDAIRFANWLHNGQGSVDTETGAYTLGELSSPSAVPLSGATITRNPGARWFLPSEGEWYKAAYHKNDGVTGNYWNYPTATDTPPTASVPPGDSNSANFNDVVGSVSMVGSYSTAFGSYGTFDQAGNVDEWNDALLDVGSDFTQVTRGIRGGGWFSAGTDVTQNLAASFRVEIHCEGLGNANCSSFARGFRVASISIIPEPGTWLLMLVGATFAFLGRRR